MRGLTIGVLHTYRSLGMILAKSELSAAPIKQKKIDIEGGHGTLDLTEFFGYPQYDDVTHKFTFAILGADLAGQYNRIKNALHGVKDKITFDDDPDYYYIGRVFVSPLSVNKSVGTISLECDCEPFRYKKAETVVTRAVDGTDIISLTNGKKRVVPLVAIQTETSLHIEYGYNVWDLGAGEYRLPELELSEGENTVSVTGAGQITFTYREADL